MAPLVQELTQTITQATTTYVTAFLLGGNQAWPTVNYVTQTLTYPSTTIVEVNIASTPTSSLSPSPSAHGGLTGSAKGAIAGSILGAFVALFLCWFCCFCCRARPSYYPPSYRSTGTRHPSPKGSLNEPSFSEHYPDPYTGGSYFRPDLFVGKNDELKEPVGEPSQSLLEIPVSESKQPHKGILKPPGGTNHPGSQNVLDGSSMSEKIPQLSTGTDASKYDNDPSETTLSADPDKSKKPKSGPPSAPDKPQAEPSKSTQPSTGTDAPKIDDAPSETKLSADTNLPKKPKSSPPSAPENPHAGSSKSTQPSRGTAESENDNASSERNLSAGANLRNKPKSSPPSGPDKPQPESSKAPPTAPREHNSPLSKTSAQSRGAPSPDPPPDPPPPPPTKKPKRHPSPPPTPPSPQLIEIRSPRTHDISSVYKKTVGYTDSTVIAREGPSKPVVFIRKLERRTIWGGWPGSGAVTRPVAGRSKSKKRGDK